MSNTDNLGGARVLIAEDDFLIAKYLTDIIETAGGSPLGPVDQWADARILAQAIPIDLALVDMRLKDGDALPVVSHLAERRVPLIVLSRYERTVLPPPLDRLPFLQKPFIAADLLDLAVLAMHRSF